MSNYHMFGSGLVQISTGTLGELPGQIIILTDVDEPMEMDVQHPVEKMGQIPLHSTVLGFPDKTALDRFIRILQESLDDWK